MERKGKGDDLTSNKVKKVAKLNLNDIVTKSNMTSRKVQELERALNENDCSSRTLYLAQDVAKIPNLPLKLSMRLLEFCIRVGNEYVFGQILKNHNIDLKTPEANQLLWTAIDNNCTEIATILVRSGADLMACEPKENCPILHKMLDNLKSENQAKMEQLFRLMIDCGADVNACNNSNKSVLNRAIQCDYCSFQLIDVLLDHNANLTVGGSYRLDDFFWACDKKPGIILKLIQHQVPDEETKNTRAITAFKKLMMSKDKKALNIMKEILDLGVPVDYACKRKDEYVAESATLLSRALFFKKKDAIKLLLDYGANPHQVVENNHTALFEATSFAGYTHATRWLIEKGADIHVCDKNGAYPIHGACQYNSEKNIHLLLSLGADINVTDNNGYTPLCYTKELFYVNNAHYLIIKHFALIIAKGGTVSDDDLALAKQYVWGYHHYNKCERQLTQMKKTRVYGVFSYFSLLSKNMFDTLQMMKEPQFVKNFKGNEHKLIDLFPQYCYMLMHTFELAEKRLSIFMEEKESIQQVFSRNVPDLVIDKITYFLCLDKLLRCRYDYYLNFHANLKCTKADKEKIL